MEINTITKIYFEGEVVSYDITYVNSNFKKSVPINEDNTDYQAIQEWIADGGTVIDNGGGE
jgi:acid stress-induced BolA-like protein IbaG/YrbA